MGKRLLATEKNCNLMGRDVMCLLDIFIVSTPSGVIVVRTADLDPPQIYMCIKCNADSLLYVYEWKFCSSVVTSINSDLVDCTTTCFSVCTSSRDH